ncbi:hypothetical protein HDL87_02895 [Bordetella pertussis]|nr:hypothetical protein HDL87_02895 [Bordetella pertussis]
MTKALLLAMMTPPGDLEEEFNEWYDTEHFPRLSTVPGFDRSSRYVAVKGWPKYVALYDLASVDALEHPQYTRAPGARFSPWAQRILTKLHGQYRFSGDQIYPGPALMGDRGRPLQVAVMRFREMPGAHEVALIEGLQAIVDSSEDLLQARVFRGSGPLQGDYIALVECRAHDPRIPVTASALGPAADHLELMTFYIPYWRRGYVPSVFEAQ